MDLATSVSQSTDRLDTKNNVEDLAALLQAGVQALTEAFESRTLATLATSARIEDSVDRLEISLNHAMIDLQLLTHSSFVQTSTHDSEMQAGLSPSTGPEVATSATEHTRLGGENLDELLGHIAREDFASSLNLPHVYGAEHFLQDGDVGINVWYRLGKQSLPDSPQAGTTPEQGTLRMQITCWLLVEPLRPVTCCLLHVCRMYTSKGIVFTSRHITGSN
jgi:hypothetical protein